MATKSKRTRSRVRRRQPLPSPKDRKKLIPLSELAKAWPSIVSPGKTEERHKMVLYRWATKGTRGVRLQCVRDEGGQRLSCIDWAIEFITALQDDDRSKKLLGKELPASQTDKELDALGV